MTRRTPSLVHWSSSSVQSAITTALAAASRAHGDTQPSSSYMNRIAGQIALGADESNADAGRLLAKETRPTFAEWCDRQYALTGNEQFNIARDEIPRRYVHGLALREAFDRYVAILGSIGVAVDLYPADVVDIIPRPGGDGVPYQIIANGCPAVPADHVLLVTGHSHNRPSSGLADGGPTDSAPRIPYAYPLEMRLTLNNVAPGSVVGVSGLRLTAIDVLLYLSEGRGAAFVSGRHAGPVERLEYIPSGLEPSRLIAFSPSGLLASCRPQNAKGDRPELHHHGVFFTVDAVRALRTIVGTPVTMPDGEVIRSSTSRPTCFPWSSSKWPTSTTRRCWERLSASAFDARRSRGCAGFSPAVMRGTCRQSMTCLNPSTRASKRRRRGSSGSLTRGRLSNASRPASDRRSTDAVRGRAHGSSFAMEPLSVDSGSSVCLAPDSGAALRRPADHRRAVAGASHRAGREGSSAGDAEQPAESGQGGL